MKTEVVKIHTAAELFPLMGETEYLELVEDIRRHGVQTRLKFIGTSWDDAQLLDGRNRLQAMQELGIPYRDHADLCTPEDIGDPVEHVLSLNLQRRHLTVSQRSMIAAKAANLKQCDNQHRSIYLSSTQAEAAEKLNVSVPTVKHGRRVLQHALPEIAQAVERGELSVSAAADVSRLPQEEQARLIAQGPKAIQAEAASLRKRGSVLPANEELEPDSEEISQFDPTQFDDGLKGPSNEEKLKKKLRFAEKLINDSDFHATQLMKLLGPLMRTVDDISDLKPSRNYQAFQPQYSRVFNQHAATLEAFREMKRVWGWILKELGEATTTGGEHAN